jgi:hypothetical protein
MEKDIMRLRYIEFVISILFRGPPTTFHYCQPSGPCWIRLGTQWFELDYIISCYRVLQRIKAKGLLWNNYNIMIKYSEQQGQKIYNLLNTELVSSSLLRSPCWSACPRDSHNVVHIICGSHDLQRIARGLLCYNYYIMIQYFKWQDHNKIIWTIMFICSTPILFAM